MLNGRRKKAFLRKKYCFFTFFSSKTVKWQVLLLLLFVSLTCPIGRPPTRRSAQLDQPDFDRARFDPAGQSQFRPDPRQVTCQLKIFHEKSASFLLESIDFN